MHKVIYKLKSLKGELLKLNRGVFSDVVNRAKEERTALIHVHEEVQANPWNEH